MISRYKYISRHRHVRLTLFDSDEVKIADLLLVDNDISFDLSFNYKLKADFIKLIAIC